MVWVSFGCKEENGLTMNQTIILLKEEQQQIILDLTVMLTAKVLLL